MIIGLPLSSGAVLVAKSAALKVYDQYDNPDNPCSKPYFDEKRDWVGAMPLTTMSVERIYGALDVENRRLFRGFVEAESYSRRSRDELLDWLKQQEG